MLLSCIIIKVNAFVFPTWNTTVPNVSVNTSGGLPPIYQTTYTIYNHTLQNDGIYNNGPIPIYYNGYFYVSWYNTLTGKESHDMRVLYSTSIDGQSWSKPMVAFENLTHVGEENEPWLIINNRLYAVSSVYDYPFEGLMRRITGPSSNDPKGDVFWLTDVVPPGLERRCNLTYLDMDNITQTDVSQYIASLVKTETGPGGQFDLVTFNERSMYLVPNTTIINDNGVMTQQLMLLLRTNDDRDDNRDWQWASTCINQMKYEPLINYVQNECRPGIGTLRENLVNIVNGYADNVHNLERCNWTKPIRTNIPNAPARTCMSSLPDGRIYLIGNIIEKTRWVLVLAVSDDGLVFDKAWAVRWYETSGYFKQASFEYPAAVLKDEYLYVTYAVNKNDIQISVIPLSAIQ